MRRSILTPLAFFDEVGARGGLRRPTDRLRFFADGDGGGAGGGDGSGDGSAGGSGDGSAGDGSGGEDKTTPKPNPAAAPQKKPGTEVESEAEKKAREEVADLPPLAQKLVAQARDDAAKARVAAAKAAEDAQKGLVEKLSEALGIKADKKADPEQLSRDLAEAKRGQLSDQRELAVFRHAGETADADRLLDSRKFMASLEAIADPKDEAAIKKAIKDFVDDNPSYKKTVRATGSSSADHSGGPRDRTTKPLSLGEAVAKAHSGADTRR